MATNAKEKISLIDNVAEHLKTQIEKGVYREQTKLPTEMELCKMYNVGRSSIREVFRVLQALGYIDIIRGRGAFVVKQKPFAPNTRWFAQSQVKLNDLMQIRQVLEPLATRLAIENNDGEEIERLVSELTEINDCYIRANSNLGSSRLIQMASFDVEFHNRIFESSKNDILVSINRQLEILFFEQRVQLMSVGQLAENAFIPHQKIIESIRARDAQRGCLEMSAHLETVADDCETITSLEDNKILRRFIPSGLGGSGMP